MKAKRFLACLLVVLLAASVWARGASEAAPGRKIVDSAGFETTVPAQPKRVVSLNPNITETVFALGKGDVLVGRSDWCDHPLDALAVESVGDLFYVNIEKVVALEPDLVLCSAIISNETVAALRSFGVPVVLLDNQESLEGTFALIDRIGEILGAEDKAEALVAAMRSRLSSVAALVSGEEKVPCYYVVGYGEGGDFTATGDTYVNEIINLAGGANVAEDGRSWFFSKELLLVRDPACLVFPEYPGSDFELDKRYFETVEPYKELTAVKEGRLFTIDGDLVDRQGPRTAEAVEAFARILHPSLF